MTARSANTQMLGKLAVIAVGMFAFGYALVPIYERICELTGINILALSERQVPGNPKVGFAQVYGAPGTASATIVTV